MECVCSFTTEALFYSIEEPISQEECKQGHSPAEGRSRHVEAGMPRDGLTPSEN
jgi:hypothetical protein